MDLARAALFIGKGMFEGKREQADLARKTEANRIAAEQKQQEMLVELAKVAMKESPQAFTELAKKIKGLEGVDLGALSSAMQDTKDYQIIGGVKVKRVELKGTESMFNQGMMQLRNLNEQLLDENTRNKIIGVLAQGGDPAKQWYDTITRYETLAREGYNKEMADKYKEKYNPAIHSFTLDAFGFNSISNLSQYFGDKYRDRQIEAEKKQIDAVLPPTPGKKGVAVTVFEQGGQSRKVALPFTDTEYSAIQEIAAAQGLDVQEFLNNYTGAGNYRDLRELPTAGDLEDGVYKGMNDRDIALSQYRMLMDAVQLKRQGFGNLDLMAAGPQKRQELLDFLDKNYSVVDAAGNRSLDVYKAATVLSFLMPTDEYFNMPRAPRPTFGPGTPGRKAAPTKSGRKYLEEERGYTAAQVTEMQNSYKYSVDTVGLLNRLYTLETVDLKDSQGFARGLKRLFEGISVQIPQVGKVFTDAFSSNDKKTAAGELEKQIFKANGGAYKKNLDGTETTAESLMASVERLNAEGKISIDLANITEADALKLTLAARMARAIDPSGRLSNQDFEIQLQRLGNALLGDGETVRRQLTVLATEFEGLAKRNLIINKIATEGRINARQARILAADQQIRSIMEYDISVAGGTTSGATAPADQQPQDAGGVPKGYIEGTQGGVPGFIKVAPGPGPNFIPKKAQ